MPGGGEEAGERAAVEGLLVKPAGEEGRHLGVIHGARREEGAQVNDGVRLDVLHVAERAQDVGGEAMAGDVVPVDAGEVEGARAAA